MKTRFHEILLPFILCNQLAYSQIADSTNDDLESQQNYIRNIVEKEKKQILKSYSGSDSSDDIHTDLHLDKLPSLDSLLSKNKLQVQIAERDATALKNATKDNGRKKSKLSKIMLIGGVSGGAIAGVLAFLLSGNGSKSGSGDDGVIDDKPPLHP